MALTTCGVLESRWKMVAGSASSLKAEAEDTRVFYNGRITQILRFVASYPMQSTEISVIRWIGLNADLKDCHLVLVHIPE